MAKRTDEGLRTADFSEYKPAGRQYQPPANLDDMGEVIEMGLEAIKGIEDGKRHIRTRRKDWKHFIRMAFHILNGSTK